MFCPIQIIYDEMRSIFHEIDLVTIMTRSARDTRNLDRKSSLFESLSKSVLLEYWYRNTSSVHLHKGASNREEKRTWLRRFARLIGRVTLRNMRRPGKMLLRIPTTGISHLVHARHSPGGFFFFRVTVTLGKYTDHNWGEIWGRSTRIILCHLTIASSDPRPRMLRTIKISESIIST